jgi:UDP-glucose 4-epimerase
MAMRILISGGLGFIGGRVAVSLAQAGHQIVLGSRNKGGSPVWLSQAELEQIRWDDETQLERICNGVDVVIHAAGMNALDCSTDPVAALDFNGLATARLVAAACRAKVQRFIYLSTAHVYASPLEGIITEETCPRNLHPYATSHLAGEYAVLGASQHGQTQGIVLRLSNVFGVPMNKDVNCWMLLVNDLCRQAVQTRKLLLHTSGQQQREFIAMTEVCRVIELLSARNCDDHETGIYNIGGGQAQSVLSIAQTIQQCCADVLGFEPELQLRQDIVNDAHETLRYKTVRLERLGIQLDGSVNNVEIKRLLSYCNITFEHSSMIHE